MSQKSYSMLTSLGLAMIAEAIRTGADIELEEMAVGSAEYAPSAGQTALMDEKARVNLLEIARLEDNPARLRVSALLPANIGGFYLYEAGLFTKNGQLFAIAKMDGSYKPTYDDGSTKEVAIDFEIEVTTEAGVKLVIDPTIVGATRAWVRSYVGPLVNDLERLIDDTAKELRNDIAGVSDDLSDHVNDTNNPHKVTAAQIGAPTINHTHTHTQITDFPAGVKAAFSQSLGNSGWCKMPNGLILQWGQSIPVMSGAFPVTVTFPIAFPSACLNIMAIPVIDSLSQYYDVWVQAVKGYTRSGATMIMQYVNATNMPESILWQAIGY